MLFILNLTKSINLYFPYNDQKIVDFVMISKTSHQRCSVKKGVLRNFTKFTGKNLFQRLWHRRLPLNFAKFLWKLLLQNTSGDCFWISERTEFAQIRIVWETKIVHDPLYQKPCLFDLLFFSVNIRAWYTFERQVEKDMDGSWSYKVIICGNQKN